MGVNPYDIVASVASTVDEGWKNLTNKVSNLTANKDIKSIRIRHDDELFIIEVAIPGFCKEDIKVEADKEKSVLVIKAEKIKQGKFMFYGVDALTYRIPLPPDAKIAEIKTECSYGVLHLTIPAHNNIKVNVVVK